TFAVSSSLGVSLTTLFFLGSLDSSVISLIYLPSSSEPIAIKSLFGFLAEFLLVKKLAEEEATKAALIQDFDDI
ncbi:hypothetical protein Tco_0930022, partial [Tanacetum coccineum]